MVEIEEAYKKLGLPTRQAVTSYLEAAIWTEEDDTKEWEDITIYTISKESFDAVVKVVDAFIDANLDRISESPMSYTQLGHDLLLTRNGHGVGFWDRDYLTKEDGEYFTNKAKELGESHIYVGDDGLLHI